MLELYAASWLAALGALALPLVLHLFGRGHERRVAVGSVAFLRPAATRRGRRLRPSDWPLLLLRCALLALLALALAEPRWRGRESTPRRPVESRVAPERGENRWLEGARRRRDGGLVVRVGRSSALRTTFESVEVPAGAEAAGIAITPRGDALELRLASGGDETADDALLLSPAPAARVWIRPSPERAAGVEFLRAGLSAAAAATGLDLEIESARAGADHPLPARSSPSLPGILFLLGREPSPAESAWVESGGWLLVEEAVGDGPCDARAQPPPLPAAAHDRLLRLRRCPQEAGGGNALWADGSGRPLLLGGRRGRGLELRLRGRLASDFWDLPLDAAFPAALLALLEARWPAASAALPGSDRRAAGAAAIAPAKVAPGAPRRAPLSSRPETLAWLALAALLVAERRRARREPA